MDDSTYSAISDATALLGDALLTHFDRATAEAYRDSLATACRVMGVTPEEFEAEASRRAGIDAADRAVRP